MSNETILRAFMQKVWNEHDIHSIAIFVDTAYPIHLDTGDPWEGKTLNHQEFETRLYYSFHSFPDIHFEVQQANADGDYVAITWIMTGANT
jgi:predicted ester cyclase